METTTSILIIAMLFVMSIGLFFIFKADAERNGKRIRERLDLELIIKRLDYTLSDIGYIHKGFDDIEEMLYRLMLEKIMETPFDEEERDFYINQHFGNNGKGFISMFFFKSEKELIRHIT